VIGVVIGKLNTRLYVLAPQLVGVLLATYGLKGMWSGATAVSAVQNIHSIAFVAYCELASQKLPHTIFYGP